MVAIFIPCRNRPDFIARQLNYYADLHSPHPVYIGDSSDPEPLEQMKKAIHRLKDRLEVHLVELPGAWITDSYLGTLPLVKEKYACFCGDDDFQIPSALTKAEEFLEKNKEFSTARGFSVDFCLKEEGPYGEISRVADYPQPEILHDTATSRVNEYLRNYYVTLFSVIRTDILLDNFKKTVGTHDRDFNSEIFPGTLPLVYGKAKLLPQLGFVRQSHPARYRQPSIFNWIIQPEWGPTYRAYLTAVSQAISHKDGVTQEDATRTVNSAFEYYLYYQLAQRNQPPASGIRDLLVQRWPRLRRVNETFKQIQQSHQIKLSQQPHPILVKGNPGHEEFQVLQKQIINPAVN